jgi:Spy/CpxP family protein refolding chaperone
MRLRCDQVSPLKFKNAVVLAISVLVSGGILSAHAADQSDDTSHKSIIGVPSMGEDFVQAPELNSHGLASPGSQFRYLKMDYAVRKDIEPDNKNDATDATPPAKKTLKGPDQNSNQNSNQNLNQSSNPSLNQSANQGANQNSNQSSTTTAQSGQSSARGDGLRLDSHSAALDLAPLNLSAEQKQKISDLHKDNVKKAREIRKLLKTKKEELATAMFDPDQTEAAIRDKRDAVRQTREQMEDLAFDEILKVRQLLNPEQKKHLAEVKPAPLTRPYWDGQGQDRAGDSLRGATGKADPSKSDQSKGPAPGKIAEAGKSDGVKAGGSKDAASKSDSKAVKADLSKQ